MFRLNINYNHSGKFFVLAALVCLSLFLSISLPNASCYAENGKAGEVLFPAYSFFVNLKKHNYKKVWSVLTSSSKKSIIAKIKSSFIKNKIKIGSQKINNSMEKGGYIAKSYWGGFLKEFKPNMVLKYSTWKIKSLRSKTALIEIDYKYAKAPTLFKMYKQRGKWKFGLFESLYNRVLMGKIVNGVLSKF